MFIVRIWWSNVFNNSVIDEVFFYFNCDIVVVKFMFSVNVDDMFKFLVLNWYE